MSAPNPPIPPPAPQPFKPVDLSKTLKNKPRDSKITFEGIDKAGLRFKIPKRKLGFPDYMSFVIIALITAVFAYITHMMLSYKDILVSIFLIVLMWGALLAWIIYEIIYIKESQTLEITRKEFRIFKKNLIKTNETVIPVRAILEVERGRAAPIVKYYKEGKEKDKVFMEFSSQDEMRWLVSIIKTIVFLAKKEKSQNSSSA